MLPAALAHALSPSEALPRSPPLPAVRSQADLLRRMYTTDVPANACVRLLNATGEVGCAGALRSGSLIRSSLQVSLVRIPGTVRLQAHLLSAALLRDESAHDC